jgi:hypothetical protein
MWCAYPGDLGGHLARGRWRLVLVRGPHGWQRAYWAVGSGAAWRVAIGSA